MTKREEREVILLISRRRDADVNFTSLRNSGKVQSKWALEI